MNKKDLLSGSIIGLICAVIIILISRFLDLPDFITKWIMLFPIVLPILSIGGVFVASIIGKKMPTIFQMAKSFLVGILNTFIDLGILNLLMWFFSVSRGWQYSVFKGLSFSCSTINSYFWNKFWTFSSSTQNAKENIKDVKENKDKKVKTKEFLQFWLVASGGFLIHIIVAPFIVNVVGPQCGLGAKVWANIGGIGAALVGFLWNFFGYKLIVFKK